MHYGQQRADRGFTIIELVVTIAVIGILATIGIVSYSGTQNRAKQQSFSSNAEQVKLKLGEYFTDKGRYPATKADVATYLGDIGNATLKTELEKSAYGYERSPAGCATTGGTPCSSYTITVAKTNWNGSASESDISVRP